MLVGGFEAIASLKRPGGRDIITWGGPMVATAAIGAGLIDEYHFKQARA